LAATAAGRRAVRALSSYAYNADGMFGYGIAGSHGLETGRPQGLNDFNLTVPENRIAARVICMPWAMRGQFDSLTPTPTPHSMGASRGR